jgi:hypothetical protein
MKILKPTTELGVSGKLTIHFRDNLFQKMGWALFANENFRRDLDLQPYHYNMVKGLIFTISIRFAFDTSEHHFHQPESLGNRRIRNYNFGTNGKRILFVF